MTLLQGKDLQCRNEHGLRVSCLRVRTRRSTVPRVVQGGTARLRRCCGCRGGYACEKATSLGEVADVDGACHCRLVHDTAGL
jgi:hypothetical protein